MLIKTEIYLFDISEIKTSTTAREIIYFSISKDIQKKDYLSEIIGSVLLVS